MRERLQVGEVAEVLGITPTAVRYYHEIGLVPEPERSEGDYRLYEAREVSRLERVRRLRSLDLSIEQVRGVLDDSQGGRERLEGALASQLEDISARLLGLEERRELIGRALAEDDPESFLLRGTAPQLEELEAAAADSETTEGQRRFRAAFRTFRWPKELLEGLVEMHRFQSKLDEDSPETARRDGRRQSGAGSAQETGQAAGGGAAQQSGLRADFRPHTPGCQVFPGEGVSGAHREGGTVRGDGGGYRGPHALLPRTRRPLQPAGRPLETLFLLSRENRNRRL